MEHKYYRHKVFWQKIRTPSNPYDYNNWRPYDGDWSFSTLDPKEHLAMLVMNDKLTATPDNYNIFRITLSHEITQAAYKERSEYSIPINQYIYSLDDLL